ncbi:MAG: YebC/PmpR family DNA-binding transcriptional regulator [Verrucomicrobiota bacterium]
MAGHSKWSQIKRKKGANDQKRGQIFSKLSKEITVAAKLGGGDPELNPRLRQAISAAKAESMPNDNIDRAIKKGTGELEGAAAYEEGAYEAYGPDGIALLIETLTDNKNRTAAEIRAILTKNNGNLGAPGSVSWMFHRKAYFYLPGATEDQALEATLEAGAEEIQPDGSGVELYAPADAFDRVLKALAAAEIKMEDEKISSFPENTTDLEVERAQKVLHLIELLEDHEDVQNVYHNLNLSDSLLASLEA